MTSSPKLSICIPTYNRAELLRDLLTSLIRETRDLGADVEVVISDNCSDDETPAVVEGYIDKLNLVYHRNSKNTGVSSNILSVTDHASGLYCWILGDDDLPVPGSIGRVVNIIDNNPEILGIVTGYSYELAGEKSDFINPNSERGFGNPVFKNEDQHGIVTRWEDTILLSDFAGLHTSIVSCVFSLSLWNKVKAETFPEMGDSALTTFENTFPYLIIWAKMFISKPIYLLSAPQVYFFIGEQEWFKPKWPTILFAFALELPDMFRTYGASEESAQHYESCIFTHSDELSQLILYPTDYSSKYFSLKHLLSRYGDDPRLFSSISGILCDLPGNRQRFRLLSKLIIAGILATHKPLKGLRQFFMTALGLGLNMPVVMLKKFQ